MAEGNPLLRPQAGKAWDRVRRDEDRDASQPSSETVEQRLLRGQRLSEQAARLRRSVSDAGKTDPSRS
jgi:hypothetical protein